MASDELMVLLIVAICVAAGIAKMWIRAKHGLPIDEKRHWREMRRTMKRFGPDAVAHHHGGGIDAERRMLLLTNENEKLAGQVGRLEERIAVLERIATDPAVRTAREIDALR